MLVKVLIKDFFVAGLSNPMHDVGSVHDTKAKGKVATVNPLNAMPAATDIVKASQQRGASASASASGETLKANNIEDPQEDGDNIPATTKTIKTSLLTMASASASALRKFVKTNSTEDLQEVGVDMPAATEIVKTSLQTMASVSGSALRESLKTQIVNTALQTMPIASASARASRERETCINFLPNVNAAIECRLSLENRLCKARQIRRQKLEIEKWLKQYSELRYDIPRELPPKRGDDDHMIELISGSSPPNKPPYRVSQAQQEEITRQVNELVDEGMCSVNLDHSENIRDTTRRLADNANSLAGAKEWFDLVVEVEVEGEGPLGGGRAVDRDEAAGGEAAGSQEVASAADDGEVAHGVDLAKLAEDVDGALVVALRDVGSEDVEEHVAHLAVELPEAVCLAQALRAVGGPACERHLECGGGAEGVGVGPRHVGRQAID
ncbi:hypothetical protein L7F22_061805 [Adiantum nelumboides]|nr:hypothetical protein [Adiantum nelumboides]